MNIYYVYGLFDNQGVPFYIGKGCRKRMLTHLTQSHNESVNDEIAKLRQSGTEPVVQKLIENISEKEALDTESFLIRSYGLRRNGGLLCNIREEGEENSVEGTHIYYDGFLFPSISLAAEKLGRTYDMINTMVEKGAAMLVDSDDYRESISDYSKYESLRDKYYYYIESFHPRHSPVWIRGFWFNSIEEAMKALGITESSVHREITRGTSFRMKHCSSKFPTWNSYYKECNKVRRLLSRGSPIIYEDKVYLTVDFCCKNENIDRDALERLLFSDDDRYRFLLHEKEDVLRGKTFVENPDIKKRGAYCVIYNGIIYKDISEVSKITGLSSKRVKSRCLSEEHKEFKYLI